MNLNIKRDSLQKDLLKWYKKSARDLPWRKTNDPYAIWISEIMLQQTQVRTVIPYYRKFLKRLPTVTKCASARLDTVLKLWEGLGYYTRVRNIHRTAKIIVKDFQGKLPRSSVELNKLPGIGRYTANALASIAFDENVPVVDGNVTRVLCRLFRIKEYPKKPTLQKKLWDIASQLLPSRQPGMFNQAMMELGAVICTPADPSCNHCPVNQYCKANKYNEQLKLPAKPVSKNIPVKKSIAVVIHKGEKLLITKRKTEGLLGGLWELPHFEHKKENIKKQVARQPHPPQRQL